MININIVNTLENKFTENSKSKNESISNKSFETNDNFKKYLNKEVGKEVKKDFVKEDKVSSLDKEDIYLDSKENLGKEDDKEVLENCFEKIKDIIDENSKGNDLDIDDINEVISLLINTLIKEELNINTEDFIQKSDNFDIALEDKSFYIENSVALLEDNLIYMESTNVSLEDKLISNLSQKNNLLLNNEDTIKNLNILNNFKLDTDNTINNLKLLNDLELDTDNTIKNLNILSDLINNMLEESNDNNINLENQNINSDGENLISNNKDNIKEIISSLINLTESNKESKINVQDINDNKETINLNDDLDIKIQNVDLEDRSNDSDFLNLLNKDIEEEDEILSKFIEEDNKVNFTTTINSYNKIRSDLSNTIQKPEIINSQTMDEDIIKSVKYMMKNNMEELTVKVYPKELGELTIKILSEEGIMKAEIRATSKEAYSILNANIADIKNSLSDQNIKIQDVQVAIYNEDTTFFKGEGNSRENREDNNYLEKNKIKSVNQNQSEEIIVEDIISNNLNLLV